MKRRVCLVLIVITVLFGCAKEEARPKAAAVKTDSPRTAPKQITQDYIVGIWGSEDAAVQATFLNNKKGYIVSYGKKGPLFSWSITDNETLKVIEADKKTVYIKVHDDKLMIGGSHSYFVKAK